MAETQAAVIDRLTEQTQRRMRGLENQRVDQLAGAYRQARDDLNAIVVAAKRAAFGYKTEWSLAEMRAYGRADRMFNEINARLAQLADQTNQIIEDGFHEQFGSSLTSTSYVLDQATPQDVEVKDPQIPEHAVRALANTEYEGAMFSQRIGMINDAMAADVRDELTQSMINGESMDEAAGRVGSVIGIDSLAEPDAYAFRSMMIARTEIMRAQNLGRLSVFAENEDLMAPGGPKWLVTADDRLCVWCLKREGLNEDEIRKKTRSDKYFAGRAVAPLHPHCRCTWAPALKSWRDLTGLDMPEEYGDEERGFRDPATGKWGFAPVKTFDEWQQDKLALSGV